MGCGEFLGGRRACGAGAKPALERDLSRSFRRGVRLVFSIRLREPGLSHNNFLSLDEITNRANGDNKVGVILWLHVSWQFN